MGETTFTRTIGRAVAVALAFALAVACSFANVSDARAAEEAMPQLGAGAAVVTTSLPDIVFTESDLAAACDLPAQDERFAGYVARSFGVAGAGDADGAGKLLGAQKVTRGDLLGDQEKLVYDRLSKLICGIAAGTEDTASIDIPLSELGVQENGYTAAELGVDSVFSESNPAEVSEEARQALNGKFNVALMRILNAVLADYPYELYWYDKTAGISFSPPAISAFDNNAGGAIVFANPRTVTFKMFVSAYYSPEGVTGGFKADKVRTAATSLAVERASAIVSENVGKGDYEKLHAYMVAIAKLTDYNYDAANNFDTDPVYGDPWQVIYVFDGKAETKVVCEGYSKAFQYLCDMSEFSDAGLACNSMTGEMYGGTGSGPHMWNVVAFGGANYLVDITNNDNYQDGSDEMNPKATTPNDELFLAGAEGSAAYGYHIEWPNPAGGDDLWIRYYYDENMFYAFSDSELTLSATAYGAGGSGSGGSGEGGDPAPAQPTDAERAQAAYDLIAAIGKVAYDARSKTAIAAARASFDALSNAQKALVSNASALANAEARYAALEAAAQKPSGSGNASGASGGASGTASGTAGGSEKPGASTSGSAASKPASTASSKARGATRSSGASASASKKAKSVSSVTINAKTVTAKVVKKAIGKNKKTVKKVVLGKKVAKIAKNAFRSFPKVKTLVVKTKKLKKSTVKKCLSGSKVKTVKVAVGSAKANKSYAKKYKKLFVKKVAGRKVTVKA